ncbi:MBL fold metallo-hydrolase [Stygiolobus azoricus]|uniref:MBL fold metallo-hydrolase n=1 Tax=Stygiolobus azoricus TaxID=41675 RepID=UPI0022AB55C9|nr:MBL fold metallo-hydrolase [Stygiolobus azoricus]
MGAFSSFTQKKFRGIEPDCELTEGELDGLQILYTPGRTSDSISIYIPSDNSIIVGDMLQGTKNGLRIPVIEELLKSIQRIKKLKPRVVYVSHGENGNNILV